MTRERCSAGRRLRGRRLRGRRLRGRGELERGAITPFVMLMCVVLTALLGLVVDGGRDLTARVTALTDAEQAARAGAAQLSGTALRRGLTSVEVGSATAVAALYLAASGHPGTAMVVGNSVVATVQTFRLPTPLLALVGIDDLPVSASASATAVAG